MAARSAGVFLEASAVNRMYEKKIWRSTIMPNVTFRFEDGTATVVAVTAGENLLEVARKANVAIDAPCSGNGSCGKCRVEN